jgi:hypothetical protein
VGVVDILVAAVGRGRSIVQVEPVVAGVEDTGEDEMVQR